MKEHITQLTMSEYINLICGDTSVLMEKKSEVLSPQKMMQARNTIIYEFRELSDPTGMQSFLIEQEDKTKTDATIILFKMCKNLLEIKEYDGVREILNEYGLNATRMSNEQIDREVTIHLNRAMTLKKKMEEENQDTTEKEITEHDIRMSYDKQAAHLMTYFKFQIDLNTIKASVFATMIDQASRELKAKSEAMKK